MFCLAVQAAQFHVKPTSWKVLRGEQRRKFEALREEEKERLRIPVRSPPRTEAKGLSGACATRRKSIERPSKVSRADRPGSTPSGRGRESAEPPMGFPPFPLSPWASGDGSWWFEWSVVLRDGGAAFGVATHTICGGASEKKGRHAGSAGDVLFPVGGVGHLVAYQAVVIGQ